MDAPHHPHHLEIDDCADCGGQDLEWMHKCYKHNLYYCRGCECPDCRDENYEEAMEKEMEENHKKEMEAKQYYDFMNEQGEI